MPQQYFSNEEVANGLANGSIVIGFLKTNSKDFKESYVNMPDNKTDVLIYDMVDRNGALYSDKVAVLVTANKHRVLLSQYLSWFTSVVTLVKSHYRSKTDGDVSSLANIFELLTVGDKLKAELEALKRPYLLYEHLVKLSDDDARNLLLDGNRKLVDLHPELVPDWRSSVESFLQPVGRVVRIIEQRHHRTFSGRLVEHNAHQYRFSPLDPRAPRLLISRDHCKKILPGDIEENTLYKAQLVDWPNPQSFAVGRLLGRIGSVNELKTHWQRVLIDYNIDERDYSEFMPQVVRNLPKQIDINKAVSLEGRRDFRDQLVLTIDPATARDFDDALHVRPWPGQAGFHEVGVHIADVSYFVEEGSPLDQVASHRTTTYYFVEKTFHMLPEELSNGLCSLSPNENKLAMSVVFKMNDEGEVIGKPWFGRSVVCSYCRLTYEQAQLFIEHMDQGPDSPLVGRDLPKVHGAYGLRDVRESVGLLQRLAVKMRQRRFSGENSALRLDKIKLHFVYNEENQPTDVTHVVLQDSNRLVEEFMLLANMAVARRLYECFPESAFLRKHREPQAKLMQEFKIETAKRGIPIEATDASGLHRAFLGYRCAFDKMGGSEEDLIKVAKFEILLELAIRPMFQAEYVCSGTAMVVGDLHHFALNTPLYTHFTSPIRRYPDIIVHRQLLYSLNSNQTTEMDQNRLQQIAEHCNQCKERSKKSAEVIQALYLTAYIRHNGPIDGVEAVVFRVLDRSFDVILLLYGCITRVYCDLLPFVEKKLYDGERLTLTYDQWKLLDYFGRDSELAGQSQADLRESTVELMQLVRVRLEGDSENASKWRTIWQPRDLN